MFNIFLHSVYSCDENAVVTRSPAASYFQRFKYLSSSRESAVWLVRYFNFTNRDLRGTRFRFITLL